VSGNSGSQGFAIGFARPERGVERAEQEAREGVGAGGGQGTEA
jgi:hypothetical protein